MIIISHRGNLTGPNPETENTWGQIIKAMDAGFYVEVDVWGIKNQLWLGHSEPKELIPIAYSHHRLIYHCKNIHAAEICEEIQAHYFMHEVDRRVLTSDGYLWTYTGFTVSKSSIACLPEKDPDWDISKAGGICTDYPLKYRELYGKS